MYIVNVFVGAILIFLPAISSFNHRIYCGTSGFGSFVLIDIIAKMYLSRGENGG